MWILLVDGLANAISDGIQPFRNLLMTISTKSYLLRLIHLWWLNANWEWSWSCLQAWTQCCPWQMEADILTISSRITRVLPRRCSLKNDQPIMRFCQISLWEQAAWHSCAHDFLLTGEATKLYHQHSRYTKLPRFFSSKVTFGVVCKVKVVTP